MGQKIQIHRIEYNATSWIDVDDIVKYENNVVYVNSKMNNGKLFGFKCKESKKEIKQKIDKAKKWEVEQ